MDLAIIYLSLLASAPALGSRIIAGLSMNLVFYLIYFFIFYYLPLLLMLMFLLAVAAWTALGLVKVQACKIRFQTLWKLAVYAATYPAVLCTAYAFITQGFTSLLYALSFAFILLLLEKMILTYPQHREKR